jgi:hypothetical protein
MPAAIIMALGAGATSALLYASVLGGSFGALILILLSPLPLFFAGLGLATRAALGAGAFATLLVGLIIGWIPAANFAVANAVPAALLVWQAGFRRPHPDGSVEWYPPGRLVLALSLYASVVFVAILIAFAGETGGLAAWLARQFMTMEASFGLAQPGAEPEPVVALVVAIIPGLAASSWLLVTAGNAILAQALLARFGRNRRPSPSLVSYALPRWLAVAAALALGAGIVGTAEFGFAGFNLALILVTPYAFEGLALLHALARRGGARPPLYALLYVALGIMLVTLSWLLVMALAGLGVVDQLARLRERLRRPGLGPRGNLE